MNVLVSPEQIRAKREGSPKARDRDLAEQIGISEAQLAAAHVGHGAVQVSANPDHLMHAAMTLKEVMALTRNWSCVHEKVGVYENYHPGKHAAMVLSDDIDLRIFPSHWKHAFAIEKETETGLRRSLQVFDAAGDAVHKIFLRKGSDVKAWDTAMGILRLSEQRTSLDVAPRATVEAPKSDVSKRDILQKEWARLTDTHQFLRLCSKLKMNRLGAYRIAGEPFARRLPPSAVDQMLARLQAEGIEVMVFVGNKGCIQIHTGPIKSLQPMGPWQNVMDPGFNLHLRLDHVAEVWAVDKPTQRGAAVSVEAFDDQGSLIFQIFGVPKKGRDSRPAWRKVVADLETLAVEDA